MTPRIITYFLCGMRHPTTGLSEDDLSRLTGSSSSTASCCSHGSSSSSSPSTSPLHQEQQQQQHQVSNVAHTNKRDKDQLTTSSATTTIAATKALDAELLKNLKNTSTHSHALTQSNNGHGHVNVNGNSSNTGSHFNSSYLPEFIDPLDWQKSRKRKERLDSTSSNTQDSKLIRSNSEELLPNDEGAAQQKLKESTTTSSTSAALKLKQQAEAIRRVASEDFKKSPYCLFDQRAEAADAAVLDPAAKGANDAVGTHGSDENNAFAANRQQQQQLEPLPPAYSETLISGPTKDMTRRSRFETSPARSNRHSPGRNGNGKHHRDSDDSECEHERRRSSERFCKSRAPPGRKAAGVMKKSGKYLPTKMRGDENAYKYDLSALKYERRGFVSKKPNTNERPNGADYNDNNLIDFHVIHSSSETAGGSSTNNMQAKITPASTEMQSNSNNKLTNNTNTTTTSNKTSETSAEALPWDSSTAADQTEPVLSRRYATVRHHPIDCIDTAAKLSKVMPYPQQFHKQVPSQLMSDDDIEPLNTFRAFTSLENLKTREVMQQVIPAMMSFQSPEERLKQVNKRLTALKKKLGQFEENFESRMGYRPSQAEKQNDKYMKNVMAEMSKLRKEKHELRVDPTATYGVKYSGDMNATKKLEKIKTSLNEIEQNLSDKREDSNRSETLDELTADQLLQEKTAVQHGLLYFESLYGRPSTKDERDAARPLYDRYRQLKRMVSRSITLSGCAASGAPELPTILEHEAMVFESSPQQYSLNNSSDSSNNTPTSDSITNSNTITGGNSTATASDESTTTTTGNVEPSSANSTISQPATSQSQSIFGENISAMTIDQLWEQLDKTREEKKLLKRTIREYETVFEEQNGRKMLKGDRKNIEETYALYKEKKAKTRLLQALIKKHISR